MQVKSLQAGPAQLRALEDKPQPLAAEFLGTLLLVFFGVGAAVLAAEYIGTLGIALTFGFVLLALAYAVGPISGSHANPAVTLGMFLAGRIDLEMAVKYWIAQIVGGIAGAALLFLIAKQVPGLQTSETFGSNGFGDRSAVHINTGGAFVAELILTFLFVYVVLAVTHKVAVVGFDGLPIGIALATVHLVGIPLTGTGVNPARSIAPAIFAGGAALTQLWLFIVAPLVGAAVAAYVHMITHPQPNRRPRTEPDVG
ncbi:MULTISPECIES: MIP family channel protein [unclassified Streptomyces]|uniref:MIP family channel protein n=1 Tax=unclassified Streptomyces TaxID=2593676 RepID=UPI002DD84B28|nr:MULTISPECIES: MIP family channel protein [unclassified Streptomyces]WSB80623.1 MIP family channel protein [Streptomyces sp. NBC_01775]WSS11167.1 MIP family channel protein [Streptomyces sp. NBC_01186]WSS39877.1 MIP family channel protein [Streptomyces sp. NBC_01187]